MNARRGRSRLLTSACSAFVALGAVLQAGCELEQVAANEVAEEGAQKALASCFGLVNFTLEPVQDEAEDFDLDFPAE